MGEAWERNTETERTRNVSASQICGSFKPFTCCFCASKSTQLFFFYRCQQLGQVQIGVRPGNLLVNAQGYSDGCILLYLYVSGFLCSTGKSGAQQVFLLQSIILYPKRVNHTSWHPLSPPEPNGVL